MHGIKIQSKPSILKHSCKNVKRENTSSHHTTQPFHLLCWMRAVPGNYLGQFICKLKPPLFMVRFCPSPSCHLPLELRAALFQDIIYSLGSFIPPENHLLPSQLPTSPNSLYTTKGVLLKLQTSGQSFGVTSSMAPVFMHVYDCIYTHICTWRF